MEERVESLLKEKVWIKEEEMEKLGKKEQESYPTLIITNYTLRFSWVKNFMDSSK